MENERTHYLHTTCCLFSPYLALNSAFTDGAARIIFLYVFFPNSNAAAPGIEPTSLDSSKVGPRPLKDALPTELLRRGQFPQTYLLLVL